MNSKRFKNLKFHRANELSDMAEDKNVVTLDVVKELLAQQERSFYAAVKVIIADIKEDVKTVKKELEGYRDSLEFTQGELKTTQHKLMDIESKIEGLALRVDEQDGYIEGVEDQVEYIENQSRRNNVKILGISEESSEQTCDDTENVVRSIIGEKLGINTDEISIERTHRVGKIPRPSDRRHDGSKVNSDRPRPIIVKFTKWKQKESVLRAARQKRPKGILFYPDYARRTINRRAEKIPRLLAERKKGNIAYFVMDELVVKPKPPGSDERIHNHRDSSPDDEVFLNLERRKRLDQEKN